MSHIADLDGGFTTLPGRFGTGGLRLAGLVWDAQAAGPAGLLRGASPTSTGRIVGIGVLSGGRDRRTEPFGPMPVIAANIVGTWIAPTGLTRVEVVTPGS